MNKQEIKKLVTLDAFPKSNTYDDWVLSNLMAPVLWLTEALTNDMGRPVCASWTWAAAKRSALYF